MARPNRVNERYRTNFLSQAATELRELAALLTEEPDARDSVTFELDKLAQTAETLDFQGIALAAREASRDLAGGAGVRALRRVAHALRHGSGRTRFGPVVLVGLPSDLADAVQQEATRCCEPVAVFDDTTAFLDGLQTEQPSVVVLPAHATDLVAQLVTREPFPVLVHGPANAGESFVAALSAGARGYLVQPFTLPEILATTRRSLPLDRPTDVLVLAAPSPERDQLVHALGQLGMVAHPLAELARVLPALEEAPIKAVIVWVDVYGRPALPFVQLVRAHPRYAHVPILVYARGEDAAALRALGAEDAMRQDVSATQAAQRVRERVDRLMSLPWTADPATGLLERAGALAAIDAELARAARTGAPVGAAIVEVDGIRELEPRAVHRARRLAAAVLRRGVRRTDPIGEIGTGEWLVGLPGCTRAVAERRMREVAAAFAQAAADDPLLARLKLDVGVADHLAGAATMLVRAEEELRRAR